jgi:hypothetical protein
LVLRVNIGALMPGMAASATEPPRDRHEKTARRYFFCLQLARSAKLPISQLFRLLLLEFFCDSFHDAT